MLIKWLHNSGAPKMFAWLANSLADKGHDVTVYTYHDFNGETVALSNKVHHLHENLDQTGLMGKIKHIRKIVKRENPNVSISFLLDANVYNLFACFGLKTKSVVCERNDPFKPRYYKLKLWKPWFRLADGAVFQLPKVAEYYSNIKAPIAIIPNPIIDKNDIVCLPYHDRKKRIVTHGRLDNEQKRHDVLIRAFALFHQEYPDYTLSIYGGDGDMQRRNEKALRSLIEELGLADCVCLEGKTSSPKRVMKDCMIWVLSSDFEGIPNSLIEAMSMGLPCVATDCSPGGARFLINDGVNGCLVERGSVKGLYEKIKYMIEHPLEAENMGREAMKIKQSFNPAMIADKWEKYLNNLKA